MITNLLDKHHSIKLLLYVIFVTQPVYTNKPILSLYAVQNTTCYLAIFTYMPLLSIFNYCRCLFDKLINKGTFY